MSPAAGRATAGVSMVMPAKAAQTPPSSSGALSPAYPNPSNPAPVADTSAAATVSRVSGRSGPCVSRRTAIGATRAARNAGISAAITVTSSPTANAAAIALPGTTNGVRATSFPAPMPAARPAPAPARPTSAASARTATIS